MDMNVSYEKGNKLEFGLKGASVPFSNLVRRYMVGRLPVFAIDRVTFYENSGSLFDEYIAHRLGGVPLVSDSGKADDEIVFTLEAEGPSTVYSRQLKSSDAKVKASIDNIPLLKLLEGQNIRLEAKARRGIGREHAKFQPGIIAYEVLSPNEFKFKLESFTQIEPRDMLSKTADLIVSHCEEMEEKLSEIKPAKGGKE